MMNLYLCLSISTCLTIQREDLIKKIKIYAEIEDIGFPPFRLTVRLCCYLTYHLNTYWLCLGFYMLQIFQIQFKASFLCGLLLHLLYLIYFAREKPVIVVI